MDNNQKRTALELSKKFLDNYNFFDKNENKYVEQMTNVINADMNDDMAKGMAIFAMTAFVSHLNYRIEIEPNNEIPINAIMFILSHSGSKKTSSERALRRALDAGYQLIEQQLLKDRMIVADRINVRESELPKLAFVSKFGTGPGLVKRINDYEELTIGSTVIICDEVASEYKSKPINMMETVQIIAEVFDSGELEDKPLKDSTNQSKPVTKTGITALMMGSEATMYGDSPELVQMRDDFTSKLARRSFFMYPLHTHSEPLYTEAEFQKLVEHKDQAHKPFVAALNQQSIAIFRKREALCEKDDNSVLQTLKIDEEAKMVYLMCKNYHEALGRKFQNENDSSQENEIIFLELINRPWKALKLAGVFAVFRLGLTISVNDFHQAMSFANNLDGELKRFLTKANELPHEKVAAFIREHGRLQNTDELKRAGTLKHNNDLLGLLESAGVLVADIGTIENKNREHAFIPHGSDKVKISQSLNQLPTESFNSLKERYIELVAMVNSADVEQRKNVEEALGVLNLDKTSDELIELLKKKTMSALKDERSRIATMQGFQSLELDFSDLPNELMKNSAFVPFHFIGGEKKLANVIPQTKILVFDIDESDEMISDVHDKLGDINHILLTTSDNKNKTKFRLIIELSKEVTLTKEHHRAVLEAFADDYRITIDKLSYEQLYLTYAEPEMLTLFDAEPFDISTLEIKIEEERRDIIELSKLPVGDLYKNRADVFKEAFSRRPGRGVKGEVILYQILSYGRKLNFTKEELLLILADRHKAFSTRTSHLEQLENEIKNDDQILSAEQLKQKIGKE